MPMSNQTFSVAASGTEKLRPLAEWMSQVRQMQKYPTMTGPVPVMSCPPVAILTKGTGASGVTITAGGTGYVSGESLTVAGGAFAAPARLRITGVNGSGTITSVAVTTPGVYTSTPANPVSVTGGSGTGATFTLTWNAGVASSMGGTTWSRSNPGFRFLGYEPKDITSGYRGNTVWGSDTQANIEFVSDAPLLDFRFTGFNSQYDLYVDGQRISAQSIKTDASGAPHIYTVDWSGVVKPRTYRLSGINTAFGGVIIQSNYGIWYPEGSRRPLVWQLGDSYTFGIGATQASFNDFRVMCDSLGLDGIADGIGGSGWTSTGSTQPQQRIQNKLTSITYRPDLIILSLGYNDAPGGNITLLQTNWRESVALIRQLCPAAKIIQIGPATPLGSTTQISAVRSALISLCAEAKIPFIDVDNWVNANNKNLYTQGDNVHPTDAGHWFRGSRLAAAISELTGFGIATPYRDALDNLNFSAGAVTTLPAGSPATATLRATPTGQKLDLGIPQGEPGADGSVLLATNYDKNDSSLALTGAATEPRILAAISEAQSSRKQVGLWNASTNTPMLTNPPTTFNGSNLSTGDFVEVSTAGTQFGITWAVGDIAKVVMANDAVTKAWYKDPVQMDRFDSKNVWASQAAGSDANSGSLYRPKSTLAGALSVVAQPGNINLASGSYAAASLSISKQNICIIGQGVNSNNNVEIAGNITTAATRVRLKNVFMTNGPSAAFTWNDAGGSHHLEQVAIATGQVGAAFVASATARGFSTIANCDFSGSIAASSIVLNNLNAGLACSTTLTNTRGVRISVGTGHTVYILACSDLQVISNAGTIIYLDNMLVRSVLTTQAQLTALTADTSTLTDGYYICDFALPTVGARGDLLLKISANGIATSVAVHRDYVNCPATLPVMLSATTQTLFKWNGGWRNLGDIYPA